MSQVSVASVVARRNSTARQATQPMKPMNGACLRRRRPATSSATPSASSRIVVASRPVPAPGSSEAT